MPSFRRLMENLAELSTVPSRVAPRAATRIAGLIDESFARGVDPYGRKWKPLRPATLDKGRHPPPLTDTWDMRRGIRVRPAQGAGIEITVPAPGHFHQSGTKHMVSRSILPDGKELPEEWEDVIEEETEATFREVLR